MVSGDLPGWLINDLFYKCPLAVIGACYVAKNPENFITIANQHIHETIGHFDGTLNHFDPMVFAANQEQN